MKKLLLLSGLAFTINANAQLTQANSAPANGDTYNMAVTSPSVLSPGASGAGTVWNYNNITLNAAIPHTALTNTNTSYNPSNVVLNYGTESSYYEATASFLKYYGGNIQLGAFGGTITYTSGAVEAIYPMSLNSTSSNAISGTLSVLSNTGTFQGNANTLADATGTLILPGKTYTNVIRVKTLQIFTITAALSGPVTQENYKYYVPGKKNPVLIINTSTTNIGSLSTQTTALVDFNYLTTTGIEANTANLVDLLVYPNPANTNITLSTASDKATSVDVTDLTGRKINTYTFTNGTCNFKTCCMAPGVYFYNIKAESGEKLSTGKFVVAH